MLDRPLYKFFESRKWLK